ncbi:MAG: L-ribulose-5-phosphate 4-epimerase [Kiritimatiellae bacterium]|nr:L-ribulose-5-phosphate 4-epimerase [Kiritimatiellia bacterium]
MNKELVKRVFEANMELPRRGLVIYTWGNVSGVDRERGIVAIKPSGVPYETMKAEDMALVSLETGEQIGGSYRPSSDLATHLALYRAFPSVGGVVHTHSRWATIFSQSGRDLPAFGTTHADHFHGAVPCTRALRPDETGGEPGHYEAETGAVIIETFRERSIDPSEVQAALVRSHGPFTWGASPEKAVENAVVLEELAFMAWHNLALDPGLPPIDQSLLDRHYCRKHGSTAYYGQSRA